MVDATGNVTTQAAGGEGEGGEKERTWSDLQHTAPPIKTTNERTAHNLLM